MSDVSTKLSRYPERLLLETVYIDLGVRVLIEITLSQWQNDTRVFGNVEREIITISSRVVQRQRLEVALGEWATNSKPPALGPAAAALSERNSCPSTV